MFMEKLKCNQIREKHQFTLVMKCPSSFAILSTQHSFPLSLETLISCSAVTSFSLWIVLVELSIKMPCPPLESMLKPNKTVETFSQERHCPVESKPWPLVSSKQFCHRDQIYKPSSKSL